MFILKNEGWVKIDKDAGTVNLNQNRVKPGKYNLKFKEF